MHFHDVWFLLLLVILPLLYLRSNRSKAALRYSSVAAVKRVYPSLRMRLRHIPAILKLTALALLIVALARPQLTNREKEVSIKGTDIILALDLWILLEGFRAFRDASPASLLSR